jgi:pantothenate kinase
MPTPPAVQATVAELVARARALIVPGGRRVLGVVGAPGAGKSTLCAALMRELGEQAALVPMDGFHLANAELLRLGRRDRKGAPDTFDAGGYAALLTRLRQAGGQTVYAPIFDRGMEEGIGSALPVSPTAPLIVTEGNYLLLEEGGWGQVRAALDEVWYLEVPESLRLSRLIARHIEFGKAPDKAEQWVQQVDEGNARLIAATRERADLIVQLTAQAWPPVPQHPVG